MRTQRIAVWVATGMTTAMLAGCRVETDKHGDNDNVKITTPFGGIQVKTDDTTAPADIGLPSYPGARLVKENKSSGSATVDMNFGHYQMRVKAASFQTDDGPAKVEAFYRDGMKRFGDVIACRDGHAVGSPVRTFEGLTCDDEGGGHVNVDEHGAKDKLELKTGSKLHQHLVEIEPKDGGTQFGMVMLDLPGKGNPDDNDSKGTE